jgi:hypothetical protein
MVYCALPVCVVSCACVQHAEKKKVLEDDLAREDFREKLELKNKEHINSFTTLKAWIEEKEAYLNKKEEV